jgi:hypothetical protein
MYSDYRLIAVIGIYSVKIINLRLKKFIHLKKK